MLDGGAVSSSTIMASTAAGDGDGHEPTEQEGGHPAEEQQCAWQEELMSQRDVSSTRYSASQYDTVHLK